MPSPRVMSDKEVIGGKCGCGNCAPKKHEPVENKKKSKGGKKK